jgi:hypothetical protein
MLRLGAFRSLVNFLISSRTKVLENPIFARNPSRAASTEIKANEGFIADHHLSNAKHLAAFCAFTGVMASCIHIFMLQETKSTRPYKLALATLNTQSLVQNEVGYPLKEPYYISTKRRGNKVCMSFRVSGPKNGGRVSFCSRLKVEL